MADSCIIVFMCIGTNIGSGDGFQNSEKARRGASFTMPGTVLEFRPYFPAWVRECG